MVVNFAKVQNFGKVMFRVKVVYNYVLSSAIFQPSAAYEF